MVAKWVKKMWSMTPWGQKLMKENKSDSNVPLQTQQALVKTDRVIQSNKKRLRGLQAELDWYRKEGGK